jgi:hypothetical protein
MSPQPTWNQILKRVVAGLLLIAIGYALYVIIRPNPGSHHVTDSRTRPSGPAATPADSSGKNNPSRMQPGQTRPGSLPGTVIVQPFQPVPPKEISSNYRVPPHHEDARVTRTNDGRIIFEQAINLARQLHSKDIPAEEDIQILNAILGYYRMMNKSNPVAGENFEVINSLMGKNKHNVVVFPMNHPDIDTDGNLLDRWGTPYFFHAISATLLDIQSAGPDRHRGSSDDLKLGYVLPGSD